MAFYHCSVKAVQRSKGQTATRSASYRAGELIHCERTGLTHDYRRKTGVMHTEIITPAGVTAPSREKLWNMAELAEKRKDSCVAREYEVALPHELSHDQRTALAQEFCKHIAETHGVAVDLCIHRPTDKEIAKGADPRNHHAHILTTTRVITNDGLGAKADNEKAGRNRKKDLESIRIAWQDFANEHLAKAGLDIELDHRSYAARHLIKVPTIKMGVAATAMERKGIRTDKGDINREIRRGNDEIYELCERQWAEEHPYYIAPRPPAPKPAPKPAPEPEPAPPPPPPPKPAPAPAPPPPPAPVIVRLPVTSSYIPNGQYLYQRPTIAIGQYIGCRGFQSVDAHLGEISVDLSTMQVVKENVTSAYPEKLRDEFREKIQLHAAEFLGVDAQGNERMGFDKYNQYLQQKHDTTFRAHESYHAELLKVINYEQQQMQQQPQHDNANDYDLGM